MVNKKEIDVCKTNVEVKRERRIKSSHPPSKFWERERKINKLPLALGARAERERRIKYSHPPSKFWERERSDSEELINCLWLWERERRIKYSHPPLKILAGLGRLGSNVQRLSRAKFTLAQGERSESEELFNPPPILNFRAGEVEYEPRACSGWTCRRVP